MKQEKQEKPKKPGEGRTRLELASPED